VLIRWLFLTWAALGSLSALVSFVQFAGKVRTAQAAHLNVYNFYIGERITGFMSNWYTFSALAMFVLIMMGSFLFFGPPRRWRIWVWLPFALLNVLGLLLAETRGVWIATAAAGLYLAWFWRRWVVLVAPVILIVGVSLSPNVIRQR